MSKLNDGEMSCKIENDAVCKDSIVKVGVTNKASCPYGVATLALGLRPRQKLAKVQAKSEA